MKTAVLVCPGRGTYNAPELGYLARHHAGRAALFAAFEAERAANDQPGLAALDGMAHYSAAVHTRGDNASALIFAASLADRLAIDPARWRIVAVTGNSMGWYSALACAGAVSPAAGFRIANTMGTLMQRHLIGGQLVYPHVGADWRPNGGEKSRLLGLVGEIASRPGHVLALSIDLGGLLVLAGNKAGLDAFSACVPVVDGRFPLHLANHAAFHTALQAPVAAAGRAALPDALFGGPELPLIDGRGALWWPHATDAAELRAYTLGHQVTEAYDFTHAIQVAAREFAPDAFIVSGPGATLNSAVAQSLIGIGWRGLADKADFQARQSTAPLLISLGMEAQRGLAV